MKKMLKTWSQITQKAQQQNKKCKEAQIENKKDQDSEASFVSFKDGKLDLGSNVLLFLGVAWFCHSAPQKTVTPPVSQAGVEHSGGVRSLVKPFTNAGLTLAMLLLETHLQGFWDLEKQKWEQHKTRDILSCSDFHVHIWPDSWTAKEIAEPDPEK